MTHYTETNTPGIRVKTSIEWPEIASYLAFQSSENQAIFLEAFSEQLKGLGPMDSDYQLAFIADWANDKENLVNLSVLKWALSGILERLN